MRPRLSAPIQLAEWRQLELEQLLEDFKTKCENTGDTVEYAFSESLTNEERRFIHLKAQLMGFITKSVGQEPHRFITVKKRTGSSEGSQTFSLKRESVILIKNMLQKSNTLNDFTHSKHNRGARMCGDKIPGKAIAWKIPPPLRAYKTHRYDLPIWKARSTIVSTIRDSRVPLLIKGGTGSGKSTQVPQYLLEDAADNKEAINIICTMPRRVAAISICDRVAFERGEDVGGTVGYKIRLESHTSKHTVLTFCTPGVLLRSLSDPSFLSGVTHLILDEVHERDKYSDFLLGYLKQERRNLTHLRIIMMSADVDVEVFSDFFETTQLIHVEGTMFPVNVLYLSAVLKLVDFKADSADLKRKKSKPRDEVNLIATGDVHDLLAEVMLNGDEFAASNLVKLVRARRVHVDFLDPELNVTILGACLSRCMFGQACELVNLGADVDKESNGWTPRAMIDMLDANWVGQFEMSSATSTPARDIEDPLVTSYLQTVDIERIDTMLIFKLVKYIHTTTSDNHGILVFLSGFEDMITLKYLLCHEDFGDPRTFRLFLLHSTIEADQRNVFKQVPQGIRKIILSTNIAETSLTIEGVAYVIDTGKVKEKSYDSQTHCSMLRSTWISKASANQRRGRAGRQCPGVCYRLYTEKRFASMDEFQLSEIVRSSLQELCLHCKAFLPPSVRITHFFSNVPEPPPLIAIKDSLNALKTMNALTHDEHLTELGKILVQFPMEPSLAKTLVYSVIFKCLDPILNIVATLCYRSPFQTLGGGEDKTAAQNARNELSGDSFSDHVAIARAFEGWFNEPYNQKRFCERYFLSHSSLKVINGVRRQLLDIMTSGFLKQYKNTDWQFFNSNSRNLSVVRAVLTIGLYPNVCKFTESKAYLFNKIDKKIKFHFQSTLSTGNISVFNLPSEWVIYGEMGRHSTSCSIIDCSFVSPCTVALFGGLDCDDVGIYDDVDEGFLTLRIGEWIALRGDTDVISEVCKLRNKWELLAEDFFTSGKLHEIHGELLKSTVKLLTLEEMQCKPLQYQEKRGRKIDVNRGEQQHETNKDRRRR